MMTAEEIFNILKEKFPDSVTELLTDKPVETFIEVSHLEIDKICTFLLESEGLKFDSLMNLSGVDDANGDKEKDENGFETIKGGTLSVWYHLESIELKHKITLKVSTERESPEVASVAEIWRSADWHEREAFDMYGIKFLNHPDLRRILYQGMKVPD